MTQISPDELSLRPGNKYSTLRILQYVVLISVILYFGRTLFIPLSFSALVSFVLYPVCKWMENKGISRSSAILFSILALMIFVAAIIYLLLIQFMSFTEEWQELKVKLTESIHQISVYVAEHFKISNARQQAWLMNLADRSGSQVIPFLRATFFSFSVSLVLLILVPVFSALILFYRKMFVNVLYAVFPGERKEKIREILHETIHAYYNFIRGMGLVYLIVGILNSVGLAIIGVPNPVLFGFIASVLTFIPYIGIIISSLLPITIAWVTYSSVWYPLGVVMVFSVVQVLEAYIIFPFAVSSRLNLNTLVTLAAVIAGGILWGAAGMILFIPFLGIVKLIADRKESLKTLSDLLGT